MKSKSIIFLVVLAAAILGIVWFVGYINRNETMPHSWRRTLKTESTEPYDLSVFYETLKITWGDNYNEIKKESTLEEYENKIDASNNGIYLFVGNNLFLTKNEQRFLKEYVNKGGTVFISGNSVPESLINQFAGVENYEINTVDAISVSVVFKNLFFDSIFNFTHYIKNEPQKASWGFFQKNEGNSNYNLLSNVDAENAIIQISALKDKGPDFMCISYGKGLVYFHANPVFFTNFYLKTDLGRQYVKQVLQHLPNKIIWMDMSSQFQKSNSHTGNNKASIYAFIASERALKYAWWTLVVGVVAFLIFAGKRKQRAIPVLKTPINNTLSFVDTIGQFYFKEKNNITVFQREWNQFLVFIKSNFHYTIADFNKGDKETLEQRSGVSGYTIYKVFTLFEKYGLAENLTAAELIDANQTFNQFYKEYKKTYGK